MTPDPSQTERTRAAILDALAEVIVESGGVGFSVQQVADRAGVTHRTVYNHFPTREALNDAFAAHLEDVLSARGVIAPSAHSVAELPPMVDEGYRMFEAYEAPTRANVMLTVASRGPAAVARERTLLFEEVIGRETCPKPPLTVRGLTAAVRMFASSTGWHLLTEHLGLSPEEARTTAVWATRALLEAAMSDHPSQDSPGHEERGESS